MKSRPQPGNKRPQQTAEAIAKAVETRETTERTLFGIHAIEAAIRNPERTIQQLWLTENAERRLADTLAATPQKARPPIERIRPKDLDKRLGTDTVHQGAAAEVLPLPEWTLGDLDGLQAAEPRPVIILDQITDPQNVGAILRSAAVFGAAALIMTRRHSPPQGGILAKAASGALEVVPIILIQNLGEAMQTLKDHAYTLFGLDGEGEEFIEDTSLNGLIGLVLGAEGKGLRQRTRDTCHKICRIAAPGPISSLNVSNAAAVTLHLAAMHRRAPK